MENVISVVGAAIVASVIGALMVFECPEPIEVPCAYVINAHVQRQKD